MSQWTHVNATIRIDAIRPIMTVNTEVAFGKPFGYGERNPYVDNPIPFGTEGSLNVTVWENPSQSSLAAYTVNIFGDLRDYDNSKAIMEYLDEATKTLMIRSGICEIDVEGQPTILYRHEDEEIGWQIVNQKQQINID